MKVSRFVLFDVQNKCYSFFYKICLLYEFYVYVFDICIVYITYVFLVLNLEIVFF